MPVELYCIFNDCNCSKAEINKNLPEKYRNLSDTEIFLENLAFFKNDSSIQNAM